MFFHRKSGRTTQRSTDLDEFYTWATFMLSVPFCRHSGSSQTLLYIVIVCEFMLRNKTNYECLFLEIATYCDNFILELSTK